MKFSLKLCAITCSLMLSSVANAGLIYTFEGGPEFTATIELNNSVTIGLPQTVTHVDVANWQFTWESATGQVQMGSATLDFLGMSMLIDTDAEVAEGTLQTPNPQLNAYGVASGWLIELGGVGYGGYAENLFTSEFDYFPIAALTVHNSAVSVPEPTPIALFAGGLLAFGVQRKLVKKRKG